MMGILHPPFLTQNSQLLHNRAVNEFGSRRGRFLRTVAGGPGAFGEGDSGDEDSTAAV